MLVSHVMTRNAITNGSAATIALCTASGILWLGEKTMTNEKRYSESGITNKSGTGEILVVTKAVTPSIRLDGTNVNPTHRARRSQVGLPERRPAGASNEGSALSGEPPPLTGSPLRDSASSSSWAGAGSERHNITAEAKTSTTSSPYPTDHHRPWLESVNSRSTTSG